MSKEIISRSKKIVKRRPPAETLGNLLFDAFRAAGVSIEPRYIDQLQLVAEKMAKVIEVEAKLAAIEHMKKLQTAIMGAFKIQDERIAAIATVLKQTNPDFFKDSEIS